jgi:hypothetical protein
VDSIFFFTFLQYFTNQIIQDFMLFLQSRSMPDANYNYSTVPKHILLSFQQYLVQHAFIIPLPSINSGTGAALRRKTNFGPAGHHHSWSSPTIFKCILKSCSVRVFSATCDSVSITQLCPNRGNFHRGNSGNLQGPSQASAVGGVRQPCYSW